MKSLRHTSGVIFKFTLPCLVLLTIFEFVGRNTSIFPTPSHLVAHFVADRSLYLKHSAATLYRAIAGLCVSMLFAYATAICFFLSPLTERVFRGVTIFTVAVPSIVLAPLLNVIFFGNTAQIILAAVMAFFPFMTAALTGLRLVDNHLIDVACTQGAGRIRILKTLRLRAGATATFVGLTVSIPAALTGAVLGEFGSGTQWGLGAFLLTSLTQGASERLWGIAALISAFCALGHAAVKSAAKLLHADADKIPLSFPVPAEVEPYPVATRILLSAISISLPFILWGAAIQILHLNPIIVPGPLTILQSLALRPTAADLCASIITALYQSLPVAGFGTVAGLSLAFSFGLLPEFFPQLTKALRSAASISQNIPIISIIPIIVTVFGRGFFAELLIVTLITFFPAYVIFREGLTRTPVAALYLAKTLGTSRIRTICNVQIPYAIPLIFTAAKLSVPQALSAVIIGEILLTDAGLGGLINNARATLDEDTVWAVACVVMTLSALLFQAIGYVESRSHRGVRR